MTCTDRTMLAVDIAIITTLILRQVAQRFLSDDEEVEQLDNVVPFRGRS